MVRLLISVEGHSEYKFVEEVVVPYLSGFDIFVQTQNMKGNIGLDRVGSKLNALIYSYDFVTTLYDFYGFQKRHLIDGETKESLEEKIKNRIKKDQRQKIIPYIQMYEFEALLFSDAEKMATGLNTNQDWINKILVNFNNIEKINNSKDAAPSKRIEKNARYIKTTHAPNILNNIGLAEIRKKCTGFDAWITRLENLNG
ncbi:hypothetical protein BHECKSOX_934 [Bathymodiolus heckerae thiotrophic gill symbiont]|uniref:DUF4276 family protein n=1 Tax=Bathymodiolus heckerae thiotrophic gill symbiont TaxID=1052212 RepID=UPI0010BA75AF|nr:DUF4276 family protein [Bathymodiolus heckerae thiotrophic gill symbiont]CAC9589220.1 hypothetical protein [uncultured Gammaproteobacteria bacterium]SHN93739.1 hypothetical protein BHECKSOX_934 [Bathymodiolus heckerae thiotrophic gill symbiont]